MPPTIKDCNCGNCSNREVNANDDSFCKVTGEELGGEFEFECTRKYGCLSHPLAREVLVADVVKELEGRIANSQAINAYPMMTVYEAISLIKNGVKKE